MEKFDITINKIRENVNKRRVEWTKHCLNRLNQREIMIRDVRQAVNNGKIIEYYYNDYPYPSCLIIGHNIRNEVLHIVCGVNKEMVYMITAYYPNKNKWEDDMKIRRGK